MYNFPNGIEILILELVTKRNLLILEWYKTPSLRPESFISELTESLIFYSEKCNNGLLMGDFNINSNNHYLKDFIYSNDFENVIKELTCFKSTSPTTIDLF